MLAGDAEADAVFAEAAELAGRLGIPDVHALALSERSLLARDDHAAAEALAAEALAVVEDGGNERYPLSALTLRRLGPGAAPPRPLGPGARAARAGARPRPSADRDPSVGEPYRRGSSSRTRSWRSATTRPRSRSSARPAGSCGSGPGSGVLAAEADALARELAAIHREAADSGQGLTAAELRLLPMLSTHMSFREIGDRLFVSRNTIKTQAISVYRKLGVSTRSAAVERAQHLGLIEPVAAVWRVSPRPDDIAAPGQRLKSVTGCM